MVEFGKMLRAKEILRRKHYAILEKAPHLFNVRFYLIANPDVADAGFDPIQHYIMHGADEGRNPSALFDTAHYLKQVTIEGNNTNPLVHFIKNDAGRRISPTPYFDHDYYRAANEDAVAGLDNLFEHYAKIGIREGRVASPLFDPKKYEAQTPDIDATGLTSLAHFILFARSQVGQEEPDDDDAEKEPPLDTFAEPPASYVKLVDRDWYLNTYPDVQAKGREPLEHFRKHGWKEGRKPNAFFDTRWYRSEYLDPEKNDVDPLQHYCEIGWRAGNDPSELFSVASYLTRYPDVKSAGIEPLDHYLRNGIREGRKRIPRDPEKRLDLPIEVMETFDLDYYTAVNPDLWDMKPERVEVHFAEVGYSSGRLYAPPSAAPVVSGVKPRAPKRPERHVAGGRPQYSRPLVIAGFHRSGTSMTTNLFHNAGLFVGDELLGANKSNPYGHFEPTDMIAFHDRLLSAAGTFWQTESDFIPVLGQQDWLWMLNYGIRNSVHPAWGFKDPRNCLFLPQWAEVFPDMRVVYVFRPAVECVHSIKRRAAHDLFRDRAAKFNRRFWLVDDLAVRMYIVYASAFLRFAETFPGDICVIALDDIIDGRDIVTEVRANWDYALADADIGDIYDSSVMSRAGPNEMIKDPKLLDRLHEVECKLRDLAQRGFTRAGTKIPT